MCSPALVACSLLTCACGRLGFADRTAGDGGGQDSARDTALDSALPSCSAVTFTPAASPAVAMGPRDLVIADLDGDGKRDIAATDQTGSLSVLLGNGDGTLRAPVEYASDANNWSIATGDLDGDGALDLAVGNYDAATVSVYLNRGDGTFRAKADYATGTGPQGVALADVNHDGVLDVVTANHGADAVSVLLGNGDGTLRARQDFATGPGAYSVAIADLDSDGAPDLAVADQGGCGGCNGNTVSVLRGNGDGTFAAKMDYATGTATQPWHVSIADLDGDGALDLVIANNFGATAASQTISVLLGDGHGAFRPHLDTPASPHPWYVAVADFDADGKLDLVVANGSDNSMSLLLGKGDGTFLPRRDFAVPNQPLAIAVGDLDGDGRPDGVTADTNGTALTVLQLQCTL